MQQNNSQVVANREAGFSYVDVLIGITILMVGVLALAAAITASVIRSREGEQRLIAKQYATSTLESVFSARDISAFDVAIPGCAKCIGWDKIGNVNTNTVQGAARGIFLTGQQTMTTDDGPDRVVGTADDAGNAINNFRREIVITDICDPERPSANCPTAGTYPVMLRRITVNITYQGSGFWRTETASTIIGNTILNQ